VGFFSRRCPVDDRSRTWIEESVRWLRKEFGAGPLRAEVVLPTPEFFPGEYTGTQADVRAVVERVCGYAGVDPDLVELEFYGEDEENAMVRELGLTSEGRGAAGHYRVENGRTIIAIDQTLAHHPTQLVATIAHELGHVRLLGEERVDPDRRDHEPLTDLLTVYLGLGVFTANAAFEFHQDSRQQRTRRIGYLPEPMFGYGLACVAWLRHEPRPAWDTYLDTNPRVIMRKGLRYLEQTAEPGLLAPADDPYR
jgi:hypothetical protein